MRLGIQEGPLAVALFLFVAACSFGTALARPISVIFDPSGKTAIAMGIADLAAMVLMATVPFAFRSLLVPGYLIVGILGLFKLYGLAPAVMAWLAVAAVALVAELAILLLARRFLPGLAPLYRRNWLAVGAWLVVVLAVVEMAMVASPPRPLVAWTVVGLAAGWALLSALPWMRRIPMAIEAEICRPPGEVFAALADHQRTPSWMDNIRWVETLPALPGVERRYRRAEVQLNGTEEVTEVRVLESRPGERLVSSVAYGPQKYAITTLLAAGGCGTRLTVALDARLPWAASMLGVRFSGVAQNTTERTSANLARLKQLLESGAFPATNP